ncbi:unnamed protein product, partial [Iphiclides podalirius]
MYRPAGQTISPDEWLRPRRSTDPVCRRQWAMLCPSIIAARIANVTNAACLRGAATKPGFDAVGPGFDSHTGQDKVL